MHATLQLVKSENCFVPDCSDVVTTHAIVTVNVNLAFWKWNACLLLFFYPR